MSPTDDLKHNQVRQEPNLWRHRSSRQDSDPRLIRESCFIHQLRTSRIRGVTFPVSPSCRPTPQSPTLLSRTLREQAEPTRSPSTRTRCTSAPHRELTSTCTWASNPPATTWTSTPLRAREPQLLSPRATTTEVRTPRARAPQQEKPRQREACALH